MERIARFEKVSYEQFKKDWYKNFEYDFINRDAKIIDKHIRDIYNNIKLPERKTSGAMGYDFHLPANIDIVTGSFEVIPTGIRCKIDKDWGLFILPRSSHGFKYGIRLSNTAGVIDSDYYYADNEGHILINLLNPVTDYVISKDVHFAQGTAFCQGIFLPYGVTFDDNVEYERHGGIGSTD